MRDFRSDRCKVHELSVTYTGHRWCNLLCWDLVQILHFKLFTSRVEEIK